MEALPQVRPDQLLQPEGYHSNDLRLGLFTKEGGGAAPGRGRRSRRETLEGVGPHRDLSLSVCGGPISSEKWGAQRVTARFPQEHHTLAHR